MKLTKEVTPKAYAPGYHTTIPHRYAIGQLVRFNGLAGPTHNIDAVYQITGTLPFSGKSLQYRIQNDIEKFERVALESDLEPSDSDFPFNS